MSTTKDFAEVIRARLTEDSELAAAVEAERIQTDAELRRAVEAEHNARFVRRKDGA